MINKKPFQNERVFTKMEMIVNVLLPSSRLSLGLVSVSVYKLYKKESPRESLELLVKFF